jgi:enterochelin esterase-like enzyme
MKTTIKSFILIISFHLVVCAQTNQSSDVQMMDSSKIFQSIPMYSNFVKDTFVIDVSLPAGYRAEPVTHYPLLILTDGNWRRPQHRTIHSLSDTGGIKKMVVVGISYPDSYDVTNIRKRDFLYGAENFLDFILSELLPFLYSNYRLTDERTLWGSSFGGYFVMYTLFQFPQKTKDVFQHYIVASPAVYQTTPFKGEPKNLLEYEAMLSQQTDSLPVDLYATVGGNEDTSAFYNPFLQLVHQIEKHHYKDFHFEYYIDPGKNHFTVWEPTLVRGLQLFLHQ